MPLLPGLSPSTRIGARLGGGRGGRKDGGREEGARTEPALFRRKHRTQAPAERESEREEETRKWEMGRKG